MTACANPAAVRFAFLAGALIIALAERANALTIEDPLTVAYVREHPDEWSVKAERGENGLVNFTVVRNLKEPRYFVAHLAVHHSGKLIAKSDSPAFGKKKGNTFYFSLLDEDLADSKFDLSESVFQDVGDYGVPEPGTIIHQFPLKAFFAASVAESEPSGTAPKNEQPKSPTALDTGGKKSGSDEQIERLVKKALKAHGGEGKLKALKAFTIKYRDAKPAGRAGTTEYFAQLPGQFRIEFGREDRADKDIQIILGAGQIHRWKKHADGKIEEVIYGGIDFPQEFWLDQLKFFGPRAVLRLSDSDHRLTLLDETQIDGRGAAGIALANSAIGVTVSLKMYFDKESGLLIAVEDGVQKSTTLFSDYKDFNGIMVAASLREITTGDTLRVKAIVSNKSELVEFKPVDKLDDKLFKEP
jgi:hypothetical protein